MIREHVEEKDSRQTEDRAILQVKDLRVEFGGIKALQGVSVEVHEGEVVSILGSNGAGKSTLLRCISGLVHPTAGEIYYQGKRVERERAAKVARTGIVMQAEGHPTFPQLTVRENLELAFYALPRNEKHLGREEYAKVIEMFPILGERQNQKAGTLSGGEQQMLSIARGLISRPKIMLMDEPSLGLAPIIIDQIFQIIDQINRLGMTILVVEQNAQIALAHSARSYVMEKGRIAVEGKSEVLLVDDRVRKVYLGEAD